MKLFTKIIALTAALCVFFLFNIYVIVPKYNEGTLYGSYTQKAERAQQIQGPKCIFIGGSATNLALDSQKFEELTGMPTCNLAISASVPLRTYMQAARNCVREGDVIILTPEYGYYSTDPYKIDEAYIDMVSIDPNLKTPEKGRGHIDYYATRFLRSFTCLNDVFTFQIKNALSSNNTIYIADSVDQYGDFSLHKGRTPTYSRKISSAKFTYKKEVFSLINSFIDEMEKRNVTVYVTYPPIDGGSYRNTQQYFSQVQEAIEAHIHQKNIIGTPFDFLYDEDFFYDTVYHIRYENRETYTTDLYEAYAGRCVG